MTWCVNTILSVTVIVVMFSPMVPLFLLLRWSEPQSPTTRHFAGSDEKDVDWQRLNGSEFVWQFLSVHHNLTTATTKPEKIWRHHAWHWDKILKKLSHQFDEWCCKCFKPQTATTCLIWRHWACENLHCPSKYNDYQIAVITSWQSSGTIKCWYKDLMPCD